MLKSKPAKKIKAINLNKFEVDISKNEHWVRYCLGAVPHFPH